jgi:hypothetical protein
MNTGMWIWKIKDCEGGDALAIAAAAKQAGFTRVYLKVADGGYLFNVTNGKDLCPDTVKVLHAAGLEVYGWQYFYGYPTYEIAAAVKRIQTLMLDGYVLDAEAEFKTADGGNKAAQIVNGIRSACPNTPLGFSSFRFPSLHPEFPWSAFLSLCDFNAPQVYWEQAHNAGDQLRRCVAEFSGMKPLKPILAVGPTYKNNGWAPTVEETAEFIETAKTLKIDISFFSWDECRRDTPQLWKTISNQGTTPPPPDRLAVVEQKVAALQNSVTSLEKAVNALKSALPK